MKVYAVVEKIGDDYDSDYDVVVGDHVYLKVEDARKKLEELVKKNRWSDFEVCAFEVKE